MKTIKGLMAIAALVAGATTATAAETLQMPYYVCGQNSYTVEAPVTVKFQGREVQAYELPNTAKEGQVFYVPAEKAVLLKDANLHLTERPLVRTTGNIDVKVWLKGVNKAYASIDATVNGKKSKLPAIYTVGSVEVVGEDMTTSLTQDGGSPLIGVRGNVTLRNAHITTKGWADNAISTLGATTPEALLDLDLCTLNLKSKSSVVTGFRNVSASGCGLSFDEYAAKRIEYDKKGRQFVTVNRAGTEAAKELVVTSTANYITMEITDTDATWSMEDGELIEVSGIVTDNAEGKNIAGDIVRLPYELCGKQHFVVGEGKTTASVAGKTVTLYELLNVADRGTVYYSPGTKALLFDNATITRHGHFVWALPDEQAPLTLIVKGTNSIDITNGDMAHIGGSVTVKGDGPTASKLTISKSGNVGSRCLLSFGDMTLSDLTLNAKGFANGFYGIIGDANYTPITLTLRRVQGDIVCQGASIQLVSGFSKMKLEGCGLSQAKHGTQPATYATNELKQNGKKLTELHLTTKQPYTTITSK